MFKPLTTVTYLLSPGLAYNTKTFCHDVKSLKGSMKLGRKCHLFAQKAEKGLFEPNCKV